MLFLAHGTQWPVTHSGIAYCSGLFELCTLNFGRLPAFFSSFNLSCSLYVGSAGHSFAVVCGLIGTAGLVRSEPALFSFLCAFVEFAAALIPHMCASVG
jgi:hypothetical protein